MAPPSRSSSKQHKRSGSRSARLSPHRHRVQALVPKPARWALLGGLIVAVAVLARRRARH